MKRILLVLGFAMFGTVVAQAQQPQQGGPSVTIEDFAYGGPGCPQGSASGVISSDGSTLSILFDEFVAEAGGETGRFFDRQSCNVRISVSVPQGISISVFSVDYRGFNGLPAGASSQFNVEYFFAGGTGPTFNQSFAGPQFEPYLIQNEVVGAAVVWSACGATPILSTNANITVISNQMMEQALATVDSEDVMAALQFNLRWRECPTE